MVDRGLLYKEWKQHFWIFLVVFAAVMLSEPFSILNDYFQYQGCLAEQKKFPDIECVLYKDYEISGVMRMFWIGGVALALSQIGFERSRGTLEFTLGLPYKRGVIFNTKYFFGISILLTAQLLSYFLSYALIVLYKVDVVHFHEYFIGSVIFCFMVYSLVMAAGAITGNPLAQLIVAFSTSILPYLLIGLPLANFRIIRSFFGGHPAFFYGETELLDYITPIMYLNQFGIQDGSLAFTLIPLAMGILFYIIGYFCFIKQQLERNGHFFLWRKMDRPIQILVILFGIWGFGTASGSNLFSYIFGMVIGSAVGFLISYFLIFKKIKQL
ncbi:MULTISPECIES: ABC transporter permease subunit [Bacillus]|uniref:ABC transporter permease subunit n=1 Tax=Bacillus TaxID=1386 RepID=UPI00080E69AB|nr:MULTISPECIES: ABC transporter permease subunit [Bacillus]MDE1382040.1 ABC transporter permease subunit [Bacillus paralicheniformis]TAI52274.1 permease [Bacillus paralicheniformis]GIN75583.1 putative ABC transporter permease YtrD [Bacillus sp. J41TS8]